MEPLNARWEPHEVPALRDLLQRALNTWEPKRRPEWALEFADYVDDYLKRRAMEAKE